jgi:hypothetical protein
VYGISRVAGIDGLEYAHQPVAQQAESDQVASCCPRPLGWSIGEKVPQRCHIGECVSVWASGVGSVDEANRVLTVRNEIHLRPLRSQS